MSELREPPLSLPPPSRLGRYVLVRKLGTGGMGEVWLAREEGPYPSLVALKRILSHLAFDARAAQMFLDEARIASQLDHPNVVRVLDVGNVDGWHYLVMEYVVGETLASIIDRAKRRRVPIPTLLAARIVAEAANGLHHAHLRRDREGRHLQIVHRDMTPPNIMVTDSGDVKVLDFGIAKAADRVARTQAGSVKGKVEYLSPEAAVGRPIDARSDLFSLGAVLFELCTQRKLFARETVVATLNAVTECRVPPPSRIATHVDPLIDQVVLRALQRDVGERYQSAQDLHDDLMRFLRPREDRASRADLARFLTDLFPEEQAERRRLFALEMGETTQPSAPLQRQAKEARPREATDPPLRTFETTSEEPTLVRPVTTGEALVITPEVTSPSGLPAAAKPAVQQPPHRPLYDPEDSEPPTTIGDNTDPAAPIRIPDTVIDDVTPVPGLTPRATEADPTPDLAEAPGPDKRTTAALRVRRKKARRARLAVGGAFLSLAAGGAIIATAIWLERKAGERGTLSLPPIALSAATTSVAHGASSGTPAAPRFPPPVEDPPPPAAKTSSRAQLQPPATTAAATDPAPVAPTSAHSGDGEGPITPALKKPRGSLEVVVTSGGHPVAAGVLFEGEWVGLSPVDIRATPGTHTIRVEQAGYLGATRNVLITPGKNAPLRIELHPQGLLPEGDEDEAEVQVEP